jgi:hypothetical protein
MSVLILTREDLGVWAVSAPPLRELTLDMITNVKSKSFGNMAAEAKTVFYVEGLNFKLLKWDKGTVHRVGQVLPMSAFMPFLRAAAGLKGEGGGYSGALQ